MTTNTLPKFSDETRLRFHLIMGPLSMAFAALFLCVKRPFAASFLALGSAVIFALISASTALGSLWVTALFPLLWMTGGLCFVLGYESFKQAETWILHAVSGSVGAAILCAVIPSIAYACVHGLLGSLSGVLSPRSAEQMFFLSVWVLTQASGLHLCLNTLKSGQNQRLER